MLTIYPEAGDTVAAFDSFLSWNGDVWEARSPFALATTKSPEGDLGRIDGSQRAALDKFMQQREEALSPVQASSQPDSIYTLLRKNEIRVLELYPGALGSELRGRLHTVFIDFQYPQEGNWRRFTNHAVSLQTRGPVWFTALSYVWGPPDFEISFQLGDSQSILITKTLSSALHHMRAKDKSVWLWIDQICINQRDISEKEHQIPLMGMIYSHATNVLIWLGDEGNDDVSLAFETLHTIRARLQLSDEKISEADFERLALPDPSNVAWWEVKQLFRRPWFTRLWTIQEVILPRTDVCVKCGKATVPWGDLAEWCATLNSCGLLRWLTANTGIDYLHAKGVRPADLKPASGGGTITRLDASRYLYAQGIQSLLTILVDTRYAQAWESKDKVYGILGLVDVDIVPKYAKNVTARQVYFEACTKVPPEEWFRLLHCVDHEAPVRPTWVPEWNVPRVTKSIGYTNMSWAIYAAGGKRSDPERGFKYPFVVPVEIDMTSQSMIVSGKIFDAVTVLGDTVTLPVIDIDNATEGNHAWASNIDIAKRCEQYPSGGTVFDAFWQTLVAGSDASGREKAPQDYSEIFSLIIDSTTGNMPSLPGQTYSPRRKKGFFTLDSLRSRKPAKTLDDLRISFTAALKNRRFAVTESGYFGLVPRGTVHGDQVCVLEGINVPFVLREAEGDDNFELVGECYVHGIMQGEVMGRNDVPLGKINIV